MHANSLKIMDKLLRKYSKQCKTVLDIGAADVNGTYRSMCEDYGLQYTGADQVKAPNVDLIMGFFDYKFDLVISGQVLEHCRNPFELMQQICSHAKKCVIVIAPFIHKEHKHPIDCWRFLPDGMEELVRAAGWVSVGSEIDDRDCWVVAHRGNNQILDK